MSRFEMITLTKAAPATTGGAKNEVDKKAEWDGKLQLPEWSNILPVGRLLAVETFPGSKVSLAEQLFHKGGFALSTVKIGAFDFPLLPGFEVAFEESTPWLCPMCNSAHGTSFGPSKNAPAKVSNMLTNKWYYNADTCALFTVSDSCYTNYVGGKSYTNNWKRAATREMFERATASFARLTAPPAPPAPPAPVTAPPAPPAPAKTAPPAPAKAK